MKSATPLSRRRFLRQAGCAGMSALPLLNTLLNLRLMQGVANADTPPANGEYRALVCILLAGGNDSFNMLVPREASAYATYQTSRSNLALTPAQLININPIDLPQYGVHYLMPELANLFETGKAAFIANVGSLIEPVQNRTQVSQNLKRLPLGLYSHSDQIEQWQTSIPHSRSGIGWGGRMADLLKDLNANQTVPMNISLDGSNVFQTGNTVAEYSITPSGAVGLTGYNAGWQQYQDLQNAMSSAVDSQLTQQYSNLLSQTFNARKKQALDAYQIFANATAPALPNGVTFPSTYLGSRLQMIAKAIQGRAAVGATRQTFFIQWGGWDHHSDVLDNQAAMLPQVSAAVGAFYNALVALGIENKVTLFTISDFGRTLTSNSLKNHKIDHVVHGAIASAAVYGAMLGASVDQIESAIGLVLAHYIPFRAIRHGHQLSDSKGASAAISAEVAVLSMRRAMRGFIGPADILRNPQAIFCLFERPAEKDTSPFDLALATAGDDFAVMGMHFKLGLYEHQSAGAIQGIISLIAAEPKLLDDPDQLLDMRILIYEPAFSIIGDPHKRDPKTRQSADHSMVYIVATLLRKAYEARRDGWDGQNGWQNLMLAPTDYAEDDSALFHPLARRLMQLIDFRHGGADFDRRYPDGIPTSVEISHGKLGPLTSGLVMYPQGHARADAHELSRLLEHKFRLLAGPAVDDVDALVSRFTNLSDQSSKQIADLYDFGIRGISP